MNKPLWFVLLLVMLEAVIVLILIPGDWTDKAIDEELVLIETNLGGESAQYIELKASQWYRSSVIDSGFYAATYHLLIPTKKEREKSRGMETMGTDWFIWVEGRISALMNVIYQFYMRGALLLTWLPYMAILFVPAVFDGVMTWLVKRTNFAYSSPVIHRYSVRAGLGMVVGLFIVFFAPIALNPMIIPVTLIGCCVTIGLALGNLQKRV